MPKLAHHLCLTPPLLSTDCQHTRFLLHLCRALIVHEANDLMGVPKTLQKLNIAEKSFTDLPRCEAGRLVSVDV